MSHRNFESVEEFKKAFDGIDRIIIDATERKHVRPQESEKQTEMYSGKKRGGSTFNRGGLIVVIDAKAHRL
jgi:hypothetical protein